ncbi:MAG: phosphoglucomutase [Desulforhopalus sp.]
MIGDEQVKELFSQYVEVNDHGRSDYLGLIKEIVECKAKDGDYWQPQLERAYALLLSEIRENKAKPSQKIAFGTSGWRGRLGKDIYARSVALVTLAIIRMYEGVDGNSFLQDLLGVKSYKEAQERGCVLGHDNRFGGELLACQVAAVLAENGFAVHYAGESTTGVLSAALLELQGAFSVNLTPSHNPLEYGGYKFNAADAGPASPEITRTITENALKLVEQGVLLQLPCREIKEFRRLKNVQRFNGLECWKDLVAKNVSAHGLSLERTIAAFSQRDDIVVAVDCVHGASRLHIRELLGTAAGDKLTVLREEADVTFGGVAPEPSTRNLQQVVELLRRRSESLKLGAIIDPDGDRIRFTDGEAEISMNQFGAMAYHFLHEYRGKKGMVAKTVATSNLANSLAAAFHEDLYEPSVGFKNFKPVIGRALVYFEESDGISVIGHTPEKDAYIGLLLALEMVLETGMNLGDYLQQIEKKFGAYYPDRDGVEVSIKGEPLLALLAKLEKYRKGSMVSIGGSVKQVAEVITIDGRKMVFDDGSWLMIRPSGTEPKVRFYVESRTPEGTKDLVLAAKTMLAEIGLQ